MIVGLSSSVSGYWWVRQRSTDHIGGILKTPIASRRRVAVTAGLAAAGLAGLLGAAAQPAAAAPAAPCVQKIAVVNNGGFVLNFQITTREGQLSAPTDTYPINQWRLIDLTSTPLEEGVD